MMGVRVQSIDNPYFELGISYGNSFDWEIKLNLSPQMQLTKALIFESSDPTLRIVTRWFN